jgi:hypothetical protein
MQKSERTEGLQDQAAHGELLHQAPRGKYGLLHQAL